MFQKTATFSVFTRSSGNIKKSGTVEKPCRLCLDYTPDSVASLEKTGWKPFICRDPLVAAISADIAGRAAHATAWPCSGGGLHCRRHCCHARCALAAPFHPCPRGRSQNGGMFSVALSMPCGYCRTAPVHACPHGLKPRRNRFHRPPAL